jgi:alkanesulfonate monooxygenase SsuD/methylene tetrahydromethanopterin reductase-like flavin-dependent oxidoreductase (luciferase family)
VEIGTLVLGTRFRNPALLALMADTIDEISGGRLILGIGAGYHAPEYRAFGYPIDHRYSKFAEAIEIIHGLLKNGSIDFEGQYYQARDCVLRLRGPRPGGPPIMVGTRGPKMLGLTARYADLWNGFILALGSQPEALQPNMSILDAACTETGRDPATLGRTATVHWSASDPPDGIPDWVSTRYAPPLTGTPEEIAGTFRAFAETGISHLQVIVWPHTLEGIEAFAPVLDALDRSG